MNAGVADILNRAALPGFSPEERMIAQRLQVYGLAGDHQIFAFRQSALLEWRDQIAAKARYNYSGAIPAEEGPSS
jgi:hypothetical protein